MLIYGITLIIQFRFHHNKYNRQKIAEIFVLNYSYQQFSDLIIFIPRKKTNLSFSLKYIGEIFINQIAKL